jgi:hypothetical protein
MIKDLNYYKENCAENYITTPISVLRYITELENKIEETINSARCCTELKDKEAMTSSEYLISLGYYKKENKWFNEHGYERDFYSLVEIYRDNY